MSKARCFLSLTLLITCCSPRLVKSSACVAVLYAWLAVSPLTVIFRPPSSRRDEVPARLRNIEMPNRNWMWASLKIIHLWPTQNRHNYGPIAMWWSCVKFDLILCGQSHIMWSERCARNLMFVCVLLQLFSSKFEDDTRTTSNEAAEEDRQ